MGEQVMPALTVHRRTFEAAKLPPGSPERLAASNGNVAVVDLLYFGKGKPLGVMGRTPKGEFLDGLLVPLT